MLVLPQGASASSPSTNSALRAIIPGMCVTAPFRMLHSPGVLHPVAEPGDMGPLARTSVSVSGGLSDVLLKGSLGPALVMLFASLFEKKPETR